MIYASLFFFFKQKTAYEMRISDWSSDVCSSDLSRARDYVARRSVGGAAYRTRGLSGQRRADIEALDEQPVSGDAAPRDLAEIRRGALFDPLLFQPAPRCPDRNGSRLHEHRPTGDRADPLLGTSRSVSGQYLSQLDADRFERGVNTQIGRAQV